MGVIKPKPKLGNKVEWQVSNRAKSAVKYYAEYTRYSEDEVVDRILLDILTDVDFIKWASSKRRKTRIMKQLFPEQGDEAETDE